MPTTAALLEQSAKLLVPNYPRRPIAIGRAGRNRHDESFGSCTQVFGDDRQCLARAVLRAGITPPPQQGDGQQQACLADWNNPRQAETTKMAA